MDSLKNKFPLRHSGFSVLKVNLKFDSAKCDDAVPEEKWKWDIKHQKRYSVYTAEGTVF